MRNAWQLVAFSDSKDRLRFYVVYALSVLSAAALSACLTGCGFYDAVRDPARREQAVTDAKQTTAEVREVLASDRDWMTKALNIATIAGGFIATYIATSKASDAKSTAVEAKTTADANSQAIKVTQGHVDQVYDATHAPRVTPIPAAPAA